MNFEFLQPSTLGEAANILNSHDDVKILAGGTDLLVELRENEYPCRYVMDIKKIPELNAFGQTAAGLEIGGAVNLNSILESGLVGGTYSALKDGARSHANTLLRNRATLIGNLCTASPGADMAPAALVLDGVLEAVSAAGSRQIPLCDFFTGVKTHVLRKNELAVKITFPQKQGQGLYLKKKRIKGHDLAQVGVAAFWAADGKLAVALGVVATTPILVSGLGPFDKKSLAGAKADIEREILSRINPRSSRRSSREYRIAIVKHFIGETISRWTEGGV
ncbi:MAG: FAD binding domain-containing protein [Spirochaetes bacterium]|nr:FAD binding domain-containing protein [Spirochaetota bacterium]